MLQFSWPFRGECRIILLSDDYSCAVVSHPNKKYLWILNRTSVMQEDCYRGILRSYGKSFDLKNLTEWCRREVIFMANNKQSAGSFDPFYAQGQSKNDSTLIMTEIMNLVKIPLK